MMADISVPTIGNPPATPIQEFQTPIGTLGTIDGTNATFTLAHLPRFGLIDVYFNGWKARQGQDYFVTGQTVTFTTPPYLGDLMEIDYWY